MSRLARRVHVLRSRDFGGVNPETSFVEAAVRSRAARKVRTHLRRMEPVVLLTPRWSRPQTFLEDLALDLAVGEPGVGCRTVSFTPLKGRPEAEARQFMVSLLAQVAPVRGNTVMVPMMADSRGFRTVLGELLERAQEGQPSPVAILGHGAEHLPVSVLEDLAEVWARYSSGTPSERRVTILLAGSVDASVDLEGANRMVLQDYGEAEAAAALVGRSGPAPRQHLETAARFTGGVPALVDAVGIGARGVGGLPRTNPGLVRALGPLADEVRGAVDIINADSWLADRLEELLRGEPLMEIPEVDRPLMLAGLIRKVRLPGEDRVMLRAPAIGAVLST